MTARRQGGQAGPGAQGGDLAAAVDQLYLAFSGCPKPRRIDGCRHCRPAGADHALLSVPLRELADSTLGRYVFSAMLTWGTADDFRYFTPRILELACSGQWKYTDLEIAFGRLGAAGWRHWPGAEARAVERVLDLLWRSTLASWPGPYGADTVLCALGGAVDDMTAFLDRWLAMIDSEAGAQHLREFIEANIMSGSQDRQLANAFWDGRDRQAAQVAGWLLSPGLKDAVTEAFLRAATPAAASALAAADQYL